MIRSASLTFISLIAVVPLSAIVVSLLSLFGYFESLFRDLQEFFFAKYFPNFYEEMINSLDTFVINARSLGILGVGFFLVTSILLLNNINSNFNAVWGSSSRRRLIEKFTTYITVVLMGTLLIATGFVFSYVLKSATRILSAEPFSVFRIFLYFIIPRIFAFVTFLLMIALVPSGYVKFSSAVVGAVTGVIGWEIAKFIFLFATTNIVQMSRIYGSLAAIPLFLIWLYTVWGIVLFSLEAAYVYQHGNRNWIGKSHERLLPRGQIMLGIRVYLLVASTYEKRGVPPSRRNISEELFLSESEVQHILGHLLNKNLIRKNETGYPRYYPIGPLDSVYLADVIDAVFGSRKFNEQSPLDVISREATDMFSSSGKIPLESRSIKDILQSN